jgi:hypothetical protein
MDYVEFVAVPRTTLRMMQALQSVWNFATADLKAECGAYISSPLEAVGATLLVDLCSALSFWPICSRHHTAKAKSYFLPEARKNQCSKFFDFGCVWRELTKKNLGRG